MNTSRLSDTLHAADSLFEAKRRPWQLEIDHQPATLVKVEPLAGRIGGKKNASCTARKTAQTLATLGRCQSPCNVTGFISSSREASLASVSRYSVKTIAGS